MSFIQLQSKGGDSKTEADYVHLAWSVWDKLKRQSRQRRFYVGKLDETGEGVVINKKFAGERNIVLPLSEMRERAKDKSEFELWLRNTCARSTGAGVDVAAKVDVVGDVHVLRALAGEIGLDSILDEVFGVETGGALLGLAMHQVATGNPLYRAAAWLEQRELPQALRGPLVSVPNVYGVVAQVGEDLDGRESFIRKWILRHKPQGTVFFDATSVSTHSDNLEMAEWGYNRDNEKMPQLNFALATARDSGLPLCYRVLPGSVPDVGTLENTLELFDDFDLKIGTISLDRGYYSGNNMRLLLGRGINVVIGLPWSSKQAKEVLMKNRKKLDSPKRGFLYGGVPMRHISTAWTVHMGKGGEDRKAEGHLMVDMSRRAEMTGRFEKAVLTIEGEAAKESFATLWEAKTWLHENAGKYSRCLGIERSREGDAFVIVRKPNKISSATARMGYTLALSAGVEGVSENPELLLDHYRGRDAVEKLFDSLKNEDGQHRLRTSNDNSAQGRFFLGFIALALRAELSGRVREADLRKNWTIPTLLDELGKVKAVTTQKGKRILLEVTKKQRELVSKLKLQQFK